MDITGTTTEAVVVVATRGHRFLAVKRGPGAVMSDYWAPPSGRIEGGETQKDALVREVQEELGVAAMPIAKVWECPAEGVDLILHWWTVELDLGELQPDPREISEVRWVTIDEFLNLEPTFAGDRYFVENVLPTLNPTR